MRPKPSKTYFLATYLAIYLSKTTQNPFKDFEGYMEGYIKRFGIEKASNLVFCYRMLRRSNEFDY